jgi:hypothetical protein
MASPNSSFGELLSLTVQELQDELFDQILTKNATTATLKEYGSVSPKDGGPTIVIPVMYAENGSYKRYSGPQQLNTSSNDVFTSFQYEWKQIAVNIQANGRELLQNSGRSQNRDLIKSRVMNANLTFQNEFNIDVLSDGTADGGLQVGGLQLLIAADPTTGTVGGVSRSSYTFARNAYYRGTTDGGAAISASNIVTYMDALDVRIQAYRGKTKVILADDITYKFYEAAVHPLQRITDTNGTLAKLGFNTYKYKQSEVVLEPSVSGMPSTTMYFLDPEVLELCPHSDRNLVRLPKRDSFNQDAQIEYLAWMGNLTAKNFRRLGTLNNN